MADPQGLGKDKQTEPVNPIAAPDRWRGASNIIAWLMHLIHNRMMPNLREFLGERQPLVWAVALVIGIGAAYFAILFRSLIGLFQLPWLGTVSENVYSAATQTPWWVWCTWVMI